MNEYFLVSLWTAEEMLYRNLAEYWQILSMAEDEDIERYLSHDKSGSYVSWLMNNGVDVSSAESIKRNALKKYYECLEKVLESYVKKICFSSLVDDEVEKYKDIMSRRRRIAGGVVARDADIVLCIDVSRSMSYQFGVRTRIDVAKYAAKRFIDVVAHRGVRLGLVVFSRSARLVENLSVDKSKLKNSVDMLSTESSTAMGEGIFLAADVLAASGGNRMLAIVLLTDGASNTGRDPLLASQYAKSLGITIYTIGIGDLVSGEFNPDTLREIADMTGGDVL